MEKKKRFLISAAYYILIFGIVFLAVKYVLGIILPFVVGFGIAALLNPLVRYLVGKYKMKVRVTSVFVLIIAYATVGTLAVLVSIRIGGWLGGFLKGLPDAYRETVEPAIGRAYEWISGIVAKFDGTAASEVMGGIGGIFESVSAALSGAVTELSVGALSLLSTVAAAVPRVVIGLGFAVISSFFFILDFEKILTAAKTRLPPRTVGFLVNIRERFFVTVIKYLRSYAIIMLITFSLLFFGLAVIGTKNAMGSAFVISLLDVLPVIGTGLIMVPWAIISIFAGNTGYGIGLLLVWGITSIVRNVAEPKIVGRQVGLHPLITLIAIFVGTKIFGFVGLILLPVGLSVAASVVREGGQASGE